MNKSKLTGTTLGLAGVLAAALVSAAPAGATDICETGGGSGLCTFWGQSYNNAQSYILYDRADLAAAPVAYYSNNGTGAGEHVYNNNGSERNGNPECNVVIYYNPNYSGYSVTLTPYATPGYQKAGSQLGHLLNNIRSFRYNYPGSPCS